MTWEYRVFREDDGAFVVREVYYADDGSIMACTEKAVAPMGESIEELQGDVEWFKEALKLPVLTLADIPSRTGKKLKRARNKNLSSAQVRAQLGLARSPKRHPRARHERAPRVLAALGKETGGKAYRTK